MQENPPIAPTQPDSRTDAQFTIRTILIAMVVVAIVASLVGPLVRSLSQEEQVRLLTTWATWLGVSVVWIAYRAKKRYAAEQLAGEVLARVEMFDEKVPRMSRGRRAFNIFGVSLLALFVLPSISMMILDVPQVRARPAFIPYVFGAFVTTSWLSKVVGMLWWRKNVRFCTNGVVWDQYVLLWNHLMECRWSEKDANLLELKGINQRNIDMRLRIPVLQDQRQQIQAILDSRKVGIPSIPVRSFAYELGRTPWADALRHPQLVRYVFGTAFKAVLILAVIYFFLSGPFGFAEFRASAFYGLIAVGVIAGVRSRWASREAGPPIVRLTGWNSWRTMLPSLLVAALCYFVGTDLSQSYAWLATLGGFGFGCSIAVLFGSVLRPLDLRENGVVLQGNTLWP
jgi:hypothetical protein